MTLRAPFPYFGGKSRVAPLVWQRFGDVRNYVEPFFGSGAVLLGRPHAPQIETVNDRDAYVWKAGGGYGRTDRGKENARRERIWFSPHCLPANAGQHSLDLDEVPA